MRTDDDSWDITESVGATALGVAAARAAESRRPDALFRDPYAEKFVDAVGGGWSKVLQGVATADSATGRIYGLFGSFMTARTVYFDDYYTAASAAGIGQIAILAAGLDARAYRLDWPAGTVIYELDQPKVLEFKARALAGERLVAQRREVAIDLRQDWPAALVGAGFDPAVPTAWLAEGLLRYLRPQDQDRLFDNIVALSAPGSRFACNLGTGDERIPDEARAAQAKVLAEAGITIDADNLWYRSADRTDPRDWFAEHGWTVSSADAAAVLTARGREVPEAARAELGERVLMTAVRP